MNKSATVSWVRDFAKAVLTRVVVSMVFGMVMGIMLLKNAPWDKQLSAGYLLGCVIFLIWIKLFKVPSQEIEKPKYIRVKGGAQYETQNMSRAFQWDDVEKIEIVTTDRGPWEDDLWWLVFFQSGDYMAISGYSENVKEIIDDIVSNLGEPNWHSIIESSGSCNMAVFPVWQRSFS